MELKVLALIKGAFKSREIWESEYPHLAPLEDDRKLLLNLASTVEREGIILAHLTMSPRTRADLEAKMPGIVDRAPAWMDAHLQGRPTMTLDLFLRGLAQTLATQRAALERVIAEQVVESEPIEETLAEAPVPAGSADEERDTLLEGVFKAMAAHMKALVALAYDLETRVRGRPEGDG